MGGINAAGRSSSFHSYKRLVCDALSSSDMMDTWQDLANRMGLLQDETILNAELIEKIKSDTLIRKINSFDTDNVICHHKVKLESGSQPISFNMKKSKLPQVLPANWQVQELDNNEVTISVLGEMDILIQDKMRSAVSSGGNIPTGFDPGKLYNSHHHPRGLTFAVYGASDAINALGMEWEEILAHIQPDEISVYAGSAIAQMDDNSMVGLIAQPLLGNRINSKMLAMSLAEMPADFINSYIINNVGATGTNVGACATFLYNLNQGVQDIQTGRAKVVVVGNAEAPVIPEILEGFRVMGAVITDEELCTLDKTTVPNHRRACRPFSTNIGFTISESAQFVILMEEELALKIGANIYGAVADVFISADANKNPLPAQALVIMSRWQKPLR